MSAGDRSGGKAKQTAGKGLKKEKWEFKIFRFGSGGSKGLKKQNSADSTDDLKGFKKGSAQGNKKRKM